jgi:hypothetical protein
LAQVNAVGPPSVGVLSQGAAFLDALQKFDDKHARKREKCVKLFRAERFPAERGGTGSAAIVLGFSALEENAL